MKTYDTAEYAASRLNETIIRLGELPVFVTSCVKSNGVIMVEYQHIVDDLPSGVKPLTDFDLDPVPLGYLNFGGQAMYLCRMPMRKDWRQGLRMLNLVDKKGYNPQRVPYKVIGQTIMGKYPSFERCLESINRKSKPPESIAFSRDFALDVRGSLIYKDHFTIGKVNLENGSTKIADKFSWTQEALAEVMEAA